MRKFLLTSIFAGITLSLLLFQVQIHAIVQQAYAGSYPECEFNTSGNYCLDTRQTSQGHYTWVTPNGSSWLCKDLGQYQCQRPYWGQCGGSIIGRCWAGLTGSKPPVKSSQILYGPVHPQQGTSACSNQAADFGIYNNLSTPDLYCVCGVDSQSICPPPSSPSPSLSPSPSVSPPPPVSPTQTATVTLVLGLPGIGYNGVAGVQPKHTGRSVTVQLYNASVTNPSGPGTTPLAQATGSVTFDSGSDNNSGYFVSTHPITLTLPANPPSGNQYEILVQVPQYLYKLAINDPSAQNPHAYTITAGANITITPLVLVAGDTATVNGGRNTLDIDDYTQILSCFTNSSACPKTTDGIPVADLDDNGVIDIVDFNLFIRSLSQLQQLNPPVCNGLSCQGE